MARAVTFAASPFGRRPRSVPVLFTIGAPGQPGQPTRFLMNQTLLRVGGGWRIASILPIPVPPQ